MPTIVHEAFGKKKRVRATFYLNGSLLPKNEAKELVHDKVIFTTKPTDLYALNNSEFRDKVVAIISEGDWDKSVEVS